MSAPASPIAMDIRPTILAVDDTPDNLTLLHGLLKDNYRVKVANGGQAALRILEGPALPDLILLDVMMPEMDGYEICRRLKANPRTSDIPVVFLTAKSDTDAERFGLDLGAVDYISKPISPPIVLARVRNHLRLKDAADFLKDKNAYLETEVQRRTRSLRAIQDATIMALASLAETRDNETGNHIRRTQHYVRLLAEELRQHPDFTHALDDETISLLYKSAPLHDIGKVGIPDAILLKPGRLTADEFEIMKSHPHIGRAAIAAALQDLNEEDRAFLDFACDIAASHHERWDGKGYPLGLAGDAIPLAGRLMALADVYDALISKRVYKPAWPHEKAVEMIEQGSGAQFDPRVVEAFLAIAEDFRSIAAQFLD